MAARRDAAPWVLAAIAAALGLLAAGDTILREPTPASQAGGTPPARAAPEAPGAGRPAGDSERVARLPTAEGVAALELVAIPETIRPDEQVVAHLVNRGEVALRAGLPFVVQRWEDGEWREVAPVEGDEARWAWPAVAVEVPPGGTTAGQAWPVEPWGSPEPGRYRLVKTAAPAGGPDGAGAGVELRVTATFRVRG